MKNACKLVTLVLILWATEVVNAQDSYSRDRHEEANKRCYDYLLELDRRSYEDTQRGMDRYHEQSRSDTTGRLIKFSVFGGCACIWLAASTVVKEDDRSAK